MGLEEGQELEHFMLNKSIETAQKRVEQHNFQRRKRTLEYDDVMNKQREVIYGFRDEVINSDDVRDRLMDIMEEVVVSKVRELTSGQRRAAGVGRRGRWPTGSTSIFRWACRRRKLSKPPRPAHELPVEGSAFDGLSAAQFAVCRFICKAARDSYELKVSFEDPDALKSVERYTILVAVDKLWQEHLYGMDSLRESIGLRAYGQRDPLVEYQSEAFKIFEELMANIKTEICHNIFRSASSVMAFDKFLRNMPQKTIHQEVSLFWRRQGPARACARVRARRQKSQRHGHRGDRGHGQSPGQVQTGADRPQSGTE